jgi:hypothetical protein
MDENLRKATPAENLMHKATQIAKGLTALAIALGALLATFPDLIDKATTAFCKIYTCDVIKPGDASITQPPNNDTNKANSSIKITDESNPNPTKSISEESSLKPQIQQNPNGLTDKTKARAESDHKLVSSSPDSEQKLSQPGNQDDAAKRVKTSPQPSKPLSYKALYPGFCSDMVAYHFTGGKWEPNKVSSTLNKNVDRLTLYVISEKPTSGLSIAIPKKDGENFNETSMQLGDIASKDFDNNWNYILPDGKLFDCDTSQYRSEKKNGYSLSIDLNQIPSGTYEVWLKTNDAKYWTGIVSELTIK